MKKQEEIKRIIWGLAAGGIQPSEALQKLSDLGVVIKVDRGLPTYAEFEQFQEEALFKAGYVAVEPLIELCPKCNKEPHLCKCPAINRGSFAKYVEEK